MRRRASGDGGVPERLMRFRVEDWPDPGSEPAWWHDQPAYPEGVVTWRIYNAEIEWGNARRRWVRENTRSLDDVNAMYDPEFGFDPSPTPDPRLAVFVRS